MDRAGRRKKALRPSRWSPYPQLWAIQEALVQAVDTAYRDEWAFWLRIATSCDTRQAASLILTARECLGPWIANDPEFAVREVYEALRDPHSRKQWKVPVLMPAPEHLEQASKAIKAAGAA